MGERSPLLFAKFVPLLIFFLLFQLDSGSKSRSLAQTLSPDEDGALSSFMSQLRIKQVQPTGSSYCNKDKWFGVNISCSNIDNVWHVTGISVSFNNLNGSISEDVTQLRHLEILDLSDNYLQGNIPQRLGLLFGLRKLDLSYNQLTESIPHSLGSLTNLDTLDLDGNELIGSVPPSLGNLKNLTYLDLSDNQLTESIPPSLGNLTKLDYLDLSDNQLTGSIPRTLRNLKNLKELYLSANQLNKSIPPSLGNLTKLYFLDLSGNQLTESIPPSLGSLTKLLGLDLSSNRLTGSIPQSLGNLKNLTMLVLDSNFLIEDVPTEYYANLTSLQHLSVCGNNLTGQIKLFTNATWSKNVNLLCLSGNNFKGELPPDISNMTNLAALWISDLHTQADSQFPDLTKLQQLQTLVLRNCNIHADMPSNIGNWSPSLAFMDLSFNKIKGEVPDSLKNLTSLEGIFLAGNMLNGTIPLWIASPNYTICDLSQNNFSEPEKIHRDNGTSIRTPNIITEPKRNFPAEMMGRYCHGQKSYNSLFINAGGEKMTYEGHSYEADTSTEHFYKSKDKRWAYTCSGNFYMFGEPYNNTRNFIKNMTCGANATLDPLYQNARLCPSSLTYYGFCLQNGNYTVTLHFAEIVFAKDEDNSITGNRVFDIYIQKEQKILRDFNIKAKADGPNKASYEDFKVKVDNNLLEIQLYWAGKGSVSFPISLHGPLISAISAIRETPLSSVKDGGLSTVQIIGIVIAAVLAPLHVLAFMWRMGWLGDRELRVKSVKLRGKSYTVKQIKDATRNFNKNNEIGKGRFGIIYKAELPDHQIVAVKKLSFQSKIDQIGTEVYALKQLKHENIVELLDVYSSRDLHLVIYEYMEKGSLKEALCADSNSKGTLDWKTRVNICHGIARGLQYLHEDNTSGEIVHRNVKASNILLDGNLKPKISDLGLAKLFDEQNPYKFIEEIGTAVYMAPEYAMRQPVTVKADVYGYGIVLVEIVSGKSNSKSDENRESDYLLNKACVLHSENRHLDLVDENLSGDYDKRQAVKIIDLAMRCINLSPNLRPAMSEVVRELELISEFDTSSA